MKKIFLMAFVLSISHVDAYMNDSSKVKPGEETGEFHYFNVTNPAAFVSAIDKHAASDCGKKWMKESGANVVIMSVSGSMHTHFVYVGYDNYKQMQKGRNIFNSCEATNDMIVSFENSTVSERYFNTIGEQSLEIGDWTGDSVFLKYDFDVVLGSESKYVDAWVDLMNNLDIPSSAGLITHLAGNRWASHFVYIGADDLDNLMNNYKENRSTSAFKSFGQKVSKIRDLKNVTVVTPIKAYSAN